MEIATHIDIDDIIAYTTLRLDGATVGDIETHLAGCASCHTSALEMRDLYWTVRSWGELGLSATEYQLAATRIALQQAQEDSETADPRLGERVRMWRERGATSKGVLRVVVESGGELGRLVVEGLENLMDTTDRWLFAIRRPLRGPLAMPGDPATILVTGAVDADGDRTDVAPGVPTASAADARGANVAVSLAPRERGHPATLIVRITGWHSPTPPLCLLRDGTRAVGVQEATPRKGALEARFEISEDGDYVVQLAVDPIAPSDEAAP
jgi:hypothetical protein